MFPRALGRLQKQECINIIHVFFSEWWPYLAVKSDGLLKPRWSATRNLKDPRSQKGAILTHAPSNGANKSKYPRNRVACRPTRFSATHVLLVVSDPSSPNVKSTSPLVALPSLFFISINNEVPLCCLHPRHRCRCDRSVCEYLVFRLQRCPFSVFTLSICWVTRAYFILFFFEVSTS